MVPEEVNRKLPLGKPLDLRGAGERMLVVNKKTVSLVLREKGTIYLVKLLYNIVFIDSCQLNT